MLKLMIASELCERLRASLRQAGHREIGGVLVGEHIEDGVFRLVDLSVQTAGGTKSCFVRRPESHEGFLDAFFAKTEHNFVRFNYLGEWHSHPSFPAWPSETDLSAMQELVENGEQGVNFALLLVVNLDWRKRLCLSANAFRPGTAPIEVDVAIESRKTRRKPWFEWRRP